MTLFDLHGTFYCCHCLSDEKKEHDFRILSWDLDHKAQSKGRPATKKLGLSDVIFLGGSAHESVGEVLKVDGTVAAVDFTNRCEHRSSPGVDVPTIALLQRCRSAAPLPFFKSFC